MKLFSVLVIILFLNAASFAQCNELTQEEYDSIKINDISFKKMNLTEGNITLMKKIVRENLNVEDNLVKNELISRIFSKNVFEIHFSYNYNENNISYFKTESITISNNRISVGDNIRKLYKSIKFNTNKDEDKNVYITLKNYDCCPIIISFNQKTFEITSIEYFVWT